MRRRGEGGAKRPGKVSEVFQHDPGTDVPDEQGRGGRQNGTRRRNSRWKNQSGTDTHVGQNTAGQLFIYLFIETGIIFFS